MSKCSLCAAASHLGGFRVHWIWGSLYLLRETQNHQEDYFCQKCLVPFFPFVSMTSNHISRVMSRHNIQSVGLLLKKISIFFSPCKKRQCWRLLTLTEHRASVVRSTSSRPAIPLRLAPRSILSSGEVSLGSTHHQPVAASQTQNISNL